MTGSKTLESLMIEVKEKSISNDIKRALIAYRDGTLDAPQAIVYIRWVCTTKYETNPD